MHKTQQLSHELIVLPVVLFLQLFFITGRSQAQFSTATFELQKASEHYDERGFTKGKALSVDGNLVVNNSNGIVSYSYPISSFTLHSYPMNVTLNYCGSVGFTSFQAYQNTRTSGCTEPLGWSKLTENKPLWIIGLNGFAVQTLSQNTEPILPPKEVNDYFSNPSTNYRPKIWLVDGYDYSNRMRDYLAQNDNTHPHLDVIRLLRSDGGILELCNLSDSRSFPETNVGMYTGKYFEKGSNTKGYAYVELKDTRPDALKTAYTTTGYTIDVNAPLLKSRRVHYFPGDGLEYIFREDVSPYGTQFYLGQGCPFTGGVLAGPTIFYLDEVRSEQHSLLQLEYKDDIRIDGVRRILKGRKQLSGFYGHTFSFGGQRGRIESFGKTVELYLDAEMKTPLPDYTMSTILLSGWEATSLPMVKRLVDPSGRQVSFDYGERTRLYTTYNWPYKYNLSDCGYASSTGAKVETHTRRLIKYNEPANYTEITYYGNTNGLDTMVNGTSSAENPYTLSEVAIQTRKKNYDGTSLLTKEFAYYPQSGTGNLDNAWETGYRVIDEITQDTTWGSMKYKRKVDPTMFSFLPGRAFTDLVETVEGSSRLATRTTTNSAFIVRTGDTLLNLRLPVNRRVEEYINGDTTTKVTKSYVSYDYELDTIIRYTTTAAKSHYSLGVSRQYENVWRPDTTSKLLYRKLTEYQIFPDSLQEYYIHHIWNKAASLSRYYELKRTDPSFTKSWEQCLLDNDDRVIVGSGLIDTIIGYPPSCIVEKGSYLIDGSDTSGYPTTRGKILQGTSKKFSSISAHHDPTLLDRNMVVSDTTFGAGGVNIVGTQIDYGTAYIQMPQTIRNSNLSRSDHVYDYQSIPASWGSTLDEHSIPIGKLRRNDNTDSTQLLTGNEHLYWWHDPIGEAGLVRKYLPLHSGIDTTYLPSLYERTYYGLHSGIIDANGWLTAARYDKIGRLRQLCLPYDFNSSTHLIEREHTMQRIEEPGYTVLELKQLQHRHVFTDTLWHYRTITENLYDYTHLHAERLYSLSAGGEESRKKGEQILITDTMWREVSSYRDTMYYGVVPFGFTCQSIEMLDSVFLEISPEQIDPCFTLFVKILKSNGLSAPTPYTLGSYQFNCDSAFSDTSTESISDTGYVNPNRHKLRFRLPDGLVSSIASAGSAGISFDVYLYATTTSKGGYFGQRGEEAIPQLKLYGIFKNDVTELT